MAAQNSSPITLDMSTAQPLQASAAPTTPVTLDMSTATPLPQTAVGTTDAPAVQPLSAWDTTKAAAKNLGAGVVQGLSDIGGAVLNPVVHPVDTIAGVLKQTPPGELMDVVEQTVPLIHAYESSRSNGASISDSLKAVNTAARQHYANLAVLPGAVKAFRENPTRTTARVLTDAAATVAAGFAFGPESAAPEVADPAEAAASSRGVWNPFRRSFYSPTAAAQPEAQAAFRQAAVASAQDAGVTAPVTAAPGAGVRTLMEQPIAEATKIEQGLYSRVNQAAGTDMKSLYDRQEELQDALDDPTQVHNKTALQAELKTTQANIATGEAKVQSVLGEDASQLISKAKAATQQRYAMETGDAKLFNNEGIVKGDVAYGADETLNVDAAIKQAQILDKPSKFAPRGTPTRLQQMMGEQGAKNFKQVLYNAQKSGKTVLTRNQIIGGLGGGMSIGSLFYELMKR